MNIADQMNPVDIKRNKIVLNANLDKTNVMNFVKFSEIAIDTLDNIIKMIIPLCGPRAIHDLVIYEHTGTNFVSNVFSHDGIHVLRSIEYMSPIQSYISNYIQYVAERVNRAAADGTSTAIYLSANIIRSALSQFKDHYRKIEASDDVTDYVDKAIVNNINAKKVADSITKLLDMMLDVIDQSKIDISSVDDTIKDIVTGDTAKSALIKKLAMITGKGNEVLADFAVKTFTNIPEILYEQISYRRSGIETDTDFMIEYPDYDTVLSVAVSGTAVYNEDLFTTIKRDNCDVLVIPYYQNTADLILDYLKKRYESDRKNIHLIIVSNGMNDSASVTLERSISPQLVTLCRYTVYHPVFANNPIELLTTLALVDKSIDRLNTVDDFDQCLITDVDIKIKGTSLHIYRMYQSTDGMHHLYISGESKIYNKLQKELAEKIATYKSAHEQKDTARESSEFVRIYKALICGKLPILTIGGSTTDHLANINVVDDVLGVVSVAMKHGIVLDIIPKLYNLLIISDDIDVSDRKLSVAILESLSHFAKLTYYPNHPCHFDGFSKNDVADLYYETSGSPKWLRDPSYRRCNVVQSYKAIKETILRIRETIPKIVSINDVIVPDSVMQGD